MPDRSAVDMLWVTLCAGLVFSMQAGFLCLESGLTRSKNAINVAIKNLTDFAVASVLYWAIGFGLMFGPSLAGWVGAGHFFTPVGAGSDTALATFFLFQVMFCATACTIVSGAVAERMRFSAYLITTSVIGLVIYPVFGHWAWGGVLEGLLGQDGAMPGWLAATGFIDFAGSSVVHSVGGWVSLAAVLVIGPRTGRFVPGEAPRKIPGGDLPMAMLGVLLLAFGWFGFNGGSTLGLDRRVPGIIVNTALAAATGILAGLAIGWLRRGYAEVLYALNGAIAGLVAITASAHAVSAAEACLIGLVGGVVMVLADELLLRLRVDDAVGAIPAHLAAGIWGTLAVGLFGDLQVLGTGLSRGAQTAVQVLGVLACGLWAFGAAWVLLRLIDRWMPLRVQPEEELLGLNVSEHGARTELVELLEAMNAQARTGALEVRVPTEPFTEVGQIAACYNQVMDKLEQAVDQTRAIVRDVRDGVITFTREGVLTSFNPGAEKLFATPAGQAIGQTVTTLFRNAGVRDQHRIHRLLTPGVQVEFRLAPASQGPQVVEVAVSESRLGQEVQLTGLVRDITERKQIEAQLHRERDLAQVTLASIGDGVVTTDERGMLQFMNPVAERLTGWEANEAMGRPISAVFRLLDARSGEIIDNPVRTVLNAGRPLQRNEHDFLVHRDGSRTPVQCTAAPIRGRDGFVIGVVLVLHDVTEALSLAHELTHQASHDALTGVPNRREFERRLADVLAKPRADDESHIVGYLDLDQFKVVNDTCGHVAGDELLRQVTALLRGRLRGSDMLARVGGDEFGVLFFNCPMPHAQRLAEALREAIEDFRFAWQGHAFAIGVSIGLAEIGPQDHVLADVLSAVDAACYAAKESGRNRVHVYRHDDARLMEHHGQMQWVARLQAALDQDRLRLYLQPIVPLHPLGDERPHHEVLLRLDEGGRIISPGSFMPAAERYNLMPRIDHWVVRNTLGWLSDVYRQHGALDGTYCINLSGASLSDERFREALRGLLEQHALPGGAVCFEITETAAVANLSKVVEFITEVKRLGCTFALDDFGSGLSSFAYLKNLPVDYLKIDGGFVRDIERDRIDLSMVQAINAIGHVMGLKTIAEFVENEAVLDRVRELGIDYAQGYHLGHPRPLEQVGQVRVMPR